MAIITLAELKEYLTQLEQMPDADERDAAYSTLEDSIIPRAEDIVQKELGVTFSAYGSPSTKAIYSDGGRAIYLPPHQAGSVSAVRAGDATATPIDASAYVYDAGTSALYVVGTGPYRPSYLPRWSAGLYTVTATWGVGPAPDAVKEVCLELAVNLWRGKDRGMWTEVVGGETAQLRFTGGLTKAQRDILRNVRRAYYPARVA